MKKILFLILLVFFVSCAKNSNFVYVPMPSFKAELKSELSNANFAKLSLKPIEFELKKEYSPYFENSVLQIRLEKEFELLLKNLELKIKDIFRAKAYEIVAEGADFEFKPHIEIVLKEELEQNTIPFFKSGVRSDLSLSLNFQAFFVNLSDKSSKKINVYNALEPMSINYNSQNHTAEFSLSQSPISMVPTQLNKNLEPSAFELDKTILSFYKNALGALNENIEKANNTLDMPQNSRQEDGVIIFE